MNTKPALKWGIRIILAAFVLMVLFPVLFVILTSLKETADFYKNIWGFPKEPAWGNFAYAWGMAKIGDAFFVSVKVVSVSVVCSLILGAFGGYGLSRLKIPKADFIVLFIFLLSMLPSESILMPSYLLVSKVHLTGTFISLVVPYICWQLPLCIYIYKNFFDTVPNELIEAARIDGASETGIFLKIVLPLVRSATITNAMFIFLGLWGEMLWASVELATSSTRTIPLALTNFIQSAGTNWGPLCAATVIILLPVVLFCIFTQKYMVAGLTGGAVKG